MRIADSVTHSFGGFEIEADKISDSSTNKYKITLPYTGALPACLAGVESAAVQIGVSICLEYKAFLLVTRAGAKKPSSYRLEATPAEIEDILERVIHERHIRPDGGGYIAPRRKGSGLTGYWVGFIQAQLVTRQRMRERPELIPDDIIVAMLQRIPAERLQQISQSRAAE